MQYDMRSRMLVYELSNDIMQKEMQREITEMKVSKSKSLIFSKHFFNMDISAAVALNFSKFGICGPKTHMEGSVSQIFNLGPSFY